MFKSYKYLKLDRRIYGFFITMKGEF